MKGIYEILTDKKWMISPDFVHGIRKAFEQNLNTHSAFQRPEKTCGFVTAKDAMGNVYYPEEYQISEDGKRVRGNWALSDEDEQNFPFISVLTVDGPITRNGGGCSYGSIDHRDMMIRAANHPLCCGHVFLINTPGGSAWAKNDYQQAIEYARSKGQPVIAFIDGMCASAGMYLASLCDERYYMHPKNEIGCIGVMAAFYTEADGSTNKFTNETYHELYDPESFDKNKAFRDIANDGKTEALVNELAELGEEFRADVKAACPAATDEHLHGKVFSADAVKGILVDDQSDFFSCIKRSFALFRGEAEPIHREAAPVPANVPDDTTVPDASASVKENTLTPTLNMENYPLINAACGLAAGEMVVTEEGTHMNAPLLDNLEAHLNAQEQTIAELKEQGDKNQEVIDAAVAKANEEHNAAVENITKEHNDAMEALKAEHQKALENLRAEFGKKETDLNAQLEEAQKATTTVTEELSSVKKTLDGAKAALATAEQTIADKDAQIAELTNAPANEPDGGESPKNNGEGANVPEMKSGIPAFDPAHPVESKAAIDAYLAKIRKG